MTSPLMVVAIGGNALIVDKQHQTVPDQMAALAETSRHIAALVEDGWRLAIGHGNGPQVGFILRRSELAAHELHEVPLDVCGADSQGAIGYELQQALGHEFARRGLDRQAVTVVTQIEVAADDPAFANPTKPIGSFLDDEAAAKRRGRRLDGRRGCGPRQPGRGRLAAADADRRAAGRQGARGRGLRGHHGRRRRDPRGRGRGGLPPRRAPR